MSHAKLVGARSRSAGGSGNAFTGVHTCGVSSCVQRIWLLAVTTFLRLPGCRLSRRLSARLLHPPGHRHRWRQVDRVPGRGRVLCKLGGLFSAEQNSSWLFHSVALFHGAQRVSLRQQYGESRLQRLEHCESDVLRRDGVLWQRVRAGEGGALDLAYSCLHPPTEFMHVCMYYSR